MKRLILFCLLLLSSVFVSAQSDNIFTLEGDGETPVVERAQSTRETRDLPYREQFTDPGAVIFHDGQFHMFRNGFIGWPAEVWVHYLVSDDGVTWEQPSDEPVLLTEDVPFATIAALASSVIVEDDGTWVLYFYTWNAPSGNISNGFIGRATADNPQGPWTVDAEPVLSPDEESDIDMRGVGAPQVIRTDDGYLMYYDAFSRDVNRAIALATSDDGITWEKYDDNPIMTAGQEWEGEMIHQARVVTVDDGYLMIYRGMRRVQGGMRLGYATSDDGITWERSESAILTPDDLENHRAFWYTAIASTADTLYLFIELMPVSNITDIFTMTAPLDAFLNE